MNTIDTRTGALVARVEVTAAANTGCGANAFKPGSHNNRPGLLLAQNKLFLAFGDYAIELDDLLIDCGSDERAVFLVTTEVTHRGEIFGMPGTGRRVENTLAFFLRFENSLIASERRMYDFTGLLVQLGVLKARAV